MEFARLLAAATLCLALTATSVAPCAGCPSSASPSTTSGPPCHHRAGKKAPAPMACCGASCHAIAHANSWFVSPARPQTPILFNSPEIQAAESQVAAAPVSHSPPRADSPPFARRSGRSPPTA